MERSAHEAQKAAAGKLEEDMADLSGAYNALEVGPPPSCPPSYMRSKNNIALYPFPTPSPTPTRLA